MPFRSEKQRRYLWAKHPDIAQRWSDEYGSKPRGKKKKRRKMRMSQDIVLCLSSNDSDVHRVPDRPLEFWKEIAHVGKFAKGDFKFAITDQDLDHWHDTFGEMSQSGIEVPVPVEHTKNPERRRGRVLQLARKKNSRGCSSLFARIKFHDADAAKLSNSGVSIFVPHEAADGYGKKFKAPIQHVAITDYPVLTDLEPFQPIMLSFVDETKQGNGAAFSAYTDADGRRTVKINPLVADAVERARAAGGLALDFNSKDDASKEKQVSPKQGAPQQSGQGQGQGDKPLDHATPGPGQNGQQPGQMTLRDLATQLGIDPSITDMQQLLQQIAAIVAQLKARAQAPMPPQMPMRPQQMPGMPGPMMPQGAMPGMGPPTMHTGRPPIQMSALDLAFDESKHPRDHGRFAAAESASSAAHAASRKARFTGDASLHEKAAKAHTIAARSWEAHSRNATTIPARRQSDAVHRVLEHGNMAKYHREMSNGLDEHSKTKKLSFDDLPEEILMALSKKQFRELKGLMLSGRSGDRDVSEPGSRPMKKGKGKKGKVSGDKSIVQRLNEKSHFGSEDNDDDDADDTYKDEDNDAFDNGEDNMDDEDTFDGSGKAGKLSHGLALSGSVLDLVKQARRTQIDALGRSITPFVKQELIKQYVDSPSVAFSAEYDDGFDRVIKLIAANGPVLPRGKTGPQVAGVAGHRVAELALSSEEAENPLLADAQRRVEGKTNFN